MSECSDFFLTEILNYLPEQQKYSIKIIAVNLIQFADIIKMNVWTNFTYNSKLKFKKLNDIKLKRHIGLQTGRQ